MMKIIKLTGQFIMSNGNGFTLIEIMVAIMILGVAIVPMVGAFAPGIFTTAGEEETLILSNQARGTMNRIGAMDFETLSGNSGYPVDLTALLGSAEEAAKEDFTFSGRAYTPIVAISDTSGGDGGLLEITVTIEHVSLKTVRAEY